MYLYLARHDTTERLLYTYKTHDYATEKNSFYTPLTD